MNTRFLVLKKNKKQGITIKVVREYLYRFFKLDKKFTSEYIVIITKLLTSDGFIPLSDKIVININNRDNIRSYVDQVSEKFYIWNKDKKDTVKIKTIYIHYIDTDAEQYKKYKKELSNYKNDSIF